MEVACLPACLPLVLACSNNRLQQLLPGIGALQCLRMLDLSDNPLGPALQEDVALLPSLASLQCNNCGLQALPDALGGRQQPKLSVLSATGNELTALPAGLACAGALVVLKAGSNKLSQLPGGLVKGLTALKELDLSHNQLEVRACAACCAMFAVLSCDRPRMRCCLAQCHWASAHQSAGCNRACTVPAALCAGAASGAGHAAVPG